MKNIIIDFNLENKIVINSYIDEILNIRRFKISLIRLNAIFLNSEIIIPIQHKEKITSIQEIRQLFLKFGFNLIFSENIKKEFENYEREEKLFEEFSQKAKSIRNDEFKDFSNLVIDYENFKKSLSLNFKRKLYPLQDLSSFHMAFSQNACNFSVPGSGKTSIVYAAYSYLKSLPENNSKHVDKLLIIGPLSSFAPWENEYFECFGKKTNFRRLSGDINVSREDKLQHLYSAEPSEITLIFHGGVDSLKFDIIDFLKRNKTMVVVDEAHRIKNPEGVWGQSITKISKEAISRVILTGTPVPNGYQDIFNLYKFIYPFKYKEILGYHFQNLTELTNSDSTDNQRVLLLKENISPFFIRIKKEDLKLPPIEEKIFIVDMDKNQREIYDYIENKYVKSFKENKSATAKDILNRAKLIRLRQAATNPALLVKPLRDSIASDIEYGENDPNVNYTLVNEQYIDDSDFFSKIFDYENNNTPAKFEIIKNLIFNIIPNNNEKVIIWSIFIQNAKQLRLYLKNNSIESKLLIGEVPQLEREEVISKFNDPTNSEFQVVIANPFAVSESISLHKGCHTAIYLERDYNCSNFLQSKDRIHRIGLNKDQITNYYYLISKDSIDEIIDEKLNIKVKRMEKIINDDIPLFNRINDDDETDIILEIIKRYDSKT